MYRAKEWLELGCSLFVIRLNSNLVLDILAAPSHLFYTKSVHLPEFRVVSGAIKRCSTISEGVGPFSSPP